MDENQPVTKFRITCVKCDEEGRKHETLIYVQWEKRYYMITCQTCGETEAFDEMAKKIEINGEEKENENTKKTESN